MARLSIIIPSRNEPYLNRTIQSVFDNARGEIEVVVHLDGYWPSDWQQVTDKYPHLHTVHSGESVGMRAGINKAVASAKSRGAKYVAKFDAHCDFGEGFDEVLKADMEPNWIVVPRRKRLNSETWQLTDTNKPDVDYHYLSFPDDPNDFGGKGLNGKIWPERAFERKDVLIDSEMSSQGSGWAMHTDYFYELELMDEANYGKFWNEFQELGLKCWLSGGQVKVNKKTWYAHWHKGKAGRGYHLPESWLTQGATFTKEWIYNDAWAKQTLPFSWLIEHFWPVPSWPENWEEVLYVERPPRLVGSSAQQLEQVEARPESKVVTAGLQIHSAHYGIGLHENSIDVTERVRELVKDNSLDIVVNNSTLTPDQNPYRGKKKSLWVTYSYDGSEPQTHQRDEKDWLIIGRVQRDLNAAAGYVKRPIAPTRQELEKEYDQAKARVGSLETGELIRDREGKTIGVARELPQGGTVVEEIANGINPLAAQKSEKYNLPVVIEQRYCPFCGQQVEVVNGRFKVHTESVDAELREVNPRLCKGSTWDYEGHELIRQSQPMSPTALNDYLIRKFSISPQRLRGPMPIELRDFHRNDLATLFAELGFKRGAEIGVAEGKYSEVLLKANPKCELLLIDPWHHYSDNPQGKSKEKHEFAYQETLRKTKDYPNVKIIKDYSNNAVRDVSYHSLDFCYIDGQHQFNFVMADLIEWSERVRSGGIVSGDDYYKLDEKRWGAGPVEAVQAYTNAHRIPIWFLCSGHKSVDFFWTKP